jgi:hypothetical protein
MDTAVLEPIRQRVRVAPRPDPLPVRDGSGWAIHAPWAVGAGVLGTAMVLGAHAATGLVACGAGGMAVLVPLVAGRWRNAVRAVHLVAGVVLLAIWSGAEAAGEFALAAGVVAVGTLATRAAASGVRDTVAPLAGRMPWRFSDLHRRGATRFGVGGLSAALFVVVLGTSPAMQIVGIALLPLSLRGYLGQLLSAREARSIWVFGTFVHLGLLALLAPSMGPAGAAWALVAAETLLFGSAALTLTRRTTELPFTVGHFSALVAAGLLGVTLTIPKSDEWPFLAAMAAGAAVAAIFFPRQQRDDDRVWG